MPCGYGMPEPIVVPEQIFQLQMLETLRDPDHFWTEFRGNDVTAFKTCFYGNKSPVSSADCGPGPVGLLARLVSPRPSVRSLRFGKWLQRVAALPQQSPSEPKCPESGLGRLGADVFSNLFDYLSPHCLFSTFALLSRAWFTAIHDEESTAAQNLSDRFWQLVYARVLRLMGEQPEYKSPWVMVDTPVGSQPARLPTTSVEIKSFFKLSGVLSALMNREQQRSLALQLEAPAGIIVSLRIPRSCGATRRVLFVTESAANWGSHCVFDRSSVNVQLYSPVHLLVPLESKGPCENMAELLRHASHRLLFTPSPPAPPPLPNQRFSVDLLNSLPLYLKFMKRSSNRWGMLRDFMQSHKLLHLIDRSFDFLLLLQFPDPQNATSRTGQVWYPTDSVLLGLHVLFLDNRSWTAMALAKFGFIPLVDFTQLLHWNANKQRAIMMATAKEFQRRFGYGDYLEGEGKPSLIKSPEVEPVAIRKRWALWFSGVQQLGVKRLAQRMCELCESTLVGDPAQAQRAVEDYHDMFRKFGELRHNYLEETHRLRAHHRVKLAEDLALGKPKSAEHSLEVPSVPVPEIPLHVDIVFHLHLMHSAHFYHDCLRELGLCVLHDPYELPRTSTSSVAGPCAIM